MRRIRSTRLACVVGGLALAVLFVPAAHAETCDGGTYDSTFALIQKVIFENHGCTNSLCHGSAASGGLNLEPEQAYANLVDVAAETVPGWFRVRTGSKDRSLLWLNLAAKTFPTDYHAPVRAMPVDPVPALSADELELVRLWIEVGAPRDGVVPGTAKLVDACLPPPKPLEIKPLAPPVPGTGVQIHMPRWNLPGHSENEVCFASYYDVTDQVPIELRQPNGTFRYKAYEMRQDPLSHHLIVTRYDGDAPPTDPKWGGYRCRGGAHDGQSCNPLDLTFCGDGGGCATDAARSFACIGFGPAGSPGTGGFGGGILVSQESSARLDNAEGVYNELPMKGVIRWNSHAFNLTDTPGKLEGWINFEFALPDEQRTPAIPIFNASKLFAMKVPPFSTQEICQVHELPPNAHLYELTSHTHKRGKRFRIFAGAWRCQGGPKDAAPCSPFGPDFDSPDLCVGAPCVSTERTPSGDCDRDGAVTIDEVITGANVALGNLPIESCLDEDGNGDGEVSVDELLVSINAVLGTSPTRPRVAGDSLLYVNLVYNDPIQLRFDPPRVYPGPASSGDERSLTYCSLYDNGFTKPDEVKRKSTSPTLSVIGIGGPCRNPSHCTDGQVGRRCSGSDTAARNASCDSTPGAGDGFCDACTLRGGETTEDEMDILIGSFYVLKQ